MATQVLRQAGPTVPAVDQAAWRLPHGGAAGAAGAVAVPTLRDVQSGGGPPPGAERPVGGPNAGAVGRRWRVNSRASVICLSAAISLPASARWSTARASA